MVPCNHPQLRGDRRSANACQSQAVKGLPMFLQKALCLDKGTRFEFGLLHPKKLRSDHIKRVGCFRARDRLLIGWVLSSTILPNSLRAFL